MRAEVLARLWIVAHDAVRACLTSYATCNHIPDATIFHECRISLRDASSLLQPANPVLTRYCEEFARNRRTTTNELRKMSVFAAALLEIHMKEAKGFLAQMDRRMPSDSVKYWDTQGSVTADSMHQEVLENSCERGDLSGFVFP